MVPQLLRDSDSFYVVVHSRHNFLNNPSNLVKVAYQYCALPVLRR